jgi:hypothetical protein
MTWPALLKGLGCLVLGTGLVLGSYLAAAGVSRPREVVGRVLGRHAAADRPAASRPQPAPTAVAAVLRLEDGRPMSFSRRDPTLSLRRHSLVAALGKSVVDLATAFNLGVGLFALVGLWQIRRQPLRPVDWLVRSFIVVYCLVAASYVARQGYVSPRHFLVVVVAAIGCAGYGLVQSGVWLASLGQSKIQNPKSKIQSTRSLACSWFLVVLAAITCLPEDVLPLRAARVGQRQAGQWLAAAAAPGAVLDTRGMSGLYSGRKTWLYNHPRPLLGDPGLAYVVLEQRELTFATARSRTLCRILELAAEPAARFADPRAAGGVGESVVVYRWYPERFSRAIALLK